MTKTSALAAACLAGGALACLPSPAAATSLIWNDAAGVHRESPDGSNHELLATPQSGTTTLLPVGNDAGDVVYFRRSPAQAQPFIEFLAKGRGPAVVNPMPWFNVTGRNVGPLGAAMDPASKQLAYSWAFDPSVTGGHEVTADRPAGIATGGADWVSPFFHAGDVAYSDGVALFYGRAAKTPWVGGSPGRRLSEVSISRDASRTLIILSEDSRRLIYSHMSGPMPSTFGEGCIVPSDGSVIRSSISPDGTMAAWTDSAGAHIASVALSPGTEEQCVVTGKRTLSPTGNSVSFSGATLPIKDAPPPPPPGGGGGTGGGGTGGGGTGAGTGGTGGGTGTGKPKACVVPKIKAGATLATARAALTRGGCKVSTTRVRSAVKKGRVVRLRVRSGTKLKAVPTGKRLGAGATVVVVLSKGRR